MTASLAEQSWQMRAYSSARGQRACLFSCPCSYRPRKNTGTLSSMAPCTLLSALSAYFVELNGGVIHTRTNVMNWFENVAPRESHTTTCGDAATPLYNAASVPFLFANNVDNCILYFCCLCSFYHKRQTHCRCAHYWKLYFNPPQPVWRLTFPWYRHSDNNITFCKRLCHKSALDSFAILYAINFTKQFWSGISWITV